MTAAAILTSPDTAAPAALYTAAMHSSVQTPCTTVTQAAARLLRDWLAARVAPPALEWLDEKHARIAGGDTRTLFPAFSAAPRFSGKQDLGLGAQDLAAAGAARAGWRPVEWSADQAARVYLLLALPAEDPILYCALLAQLFTAADVREQIALYQSLPLLRHAALHEDRAAEGVRSSMTSVFDAIALRNPYPADHLPEAAWNQLVLKAAFLGRPLRAVQGLERRANPRLARMLIDFAQERRAAQRVISAELWPLVTPFVHDAAVLSALRPDG